MRPHVNLLEDVDTGQDEEDPRTPGSSRQQQAKSENDSSLVFLADICTKLSQVGAESEPNLDHLHHKQQREGQRGHHQEDGEHGEDDGTYSWTLVTSLLTASLLARHPRTE